MLRMYRPAIDTVLLDVDGTLVDSNDAHAHAWLEALAEIGVGPGYATVRALIGMGADQLLPHVSPDLAVTREPGKTAARREGEIFKARYLASIEPMPGARELLSTLRNHGVRRVVATSASSEQVDALLKIAGVSDLIDARATANDAERSKPAADIVHAALLAARARLVNAVLLGDTRYDIQAAAAAGLPAIALRCGGSPESDLADAAATFDTPLAVARALETQTLRNIVANAGSRLTDELHAEK